MLRDSMLNFNQLSKSGLVSALCFALVPLLPDLVAPLLFPLPLLFLLFQKEGRARLVDFFRKKDPLLICSALFVAVSFLGVIWSSDPVVSLWIVALWVVCLASTVGVGCSLQSRTDLHFALLGMSLGAVCTSIIALFQWLALETGFGLPNPLWVPLEQEIINALPGINVDFTFTAHRCCATFFNSGVFGFYLVTVIPAVCVFFLRTKSRLFCLISFVAFLICAAGLFSCFSRMSYISFLSVMLISAVGCILLRYQKLRYRHRWAKWWLMGCLTAIPVVLCLMLVFLPESVIDRFFSAFSSDNSIRTRWALWTASAYQLLEEPFGIFFGYGTGVQPVWNIYQNISWLKITGIDESHAHNLYLQLVMEGGLVRLLPFLGCCFAFIARLFRLRKGERMRNTLTLFLMGMCLVALMLNGLTDYVFIDPKLCFLFMALMGVGISLPTFIGTKTSSVSEMAEHLGGER